MCARTWQPVASHSIVDWGRTSSTGVLVGLLVTLYLQCHFHQLPPLYSDLCSLLLASVLMSFVVCRPGGLVVLAWYGCQGFHTCSGQVDTPAEWILMMKAQGYPLKWVWLMVGSVLCVGACSQWWRACSQCQLCSFLPQRITEFGMLWFWHWSFSEHFTNRVY